MRVFFHWLPASSTLLLLALALLTLGATGCGVHDEAPIATVSVAPLATEDLAAPCIYDLVVAQPSLPVNGLLVLFARPDTETLYTDPAVREQAASLGYGIVFAHQCIAKTFGDLQPDASKGPGRALLQAMKQFAIVTSHPELEQSPLILYGFSAAGILTATMADQAPGRIIGSIEYAAGDFYYNLDQLQASPNAIRIPTLILANAHDLASGTYRNYHYFLRGRQQGAPWAYAVQNATGHCCNLSTRSIILPWIAAIATTHGISQNNVASQAGGSKASAPASSNPGSMVQFVCTPDGITDANGYTDCRFSAASLETSIASGGTSAWLPDSASAAAWLKWVTHPSTN